MIIIEGNVNNERLWLLYNGLFLLYFFMQTELAGTKEKTAIAALLKKCAKGYLFRLMPRTFC